MALKIGIDASCWGNKRGYGRFTKELIGTLLTIDTQNEYRLFLDAETARQAHDLPEGHSQVIVETSQAAAQAASASGNRSLGDLWAMRQSVYQNGRDLDIFYFPAEYTFFPIKSPAKVVVTLHDTTAERYPELIFPNSRSQLFWNIKVRWAIRRANLLATVSETSKREIIKEFGLEESQVRVIYDAVDSTFHPMSDQLGIAKVLKEYGVDARDRFILYVGGISPHKNLATLVDAYASVVRSSDFKDLKLVFVGDYEGDVFYSSYPAIRKKVADLGLNESVIFTGYVSDRDLVCFYNAAKLFVLPSFNEGFGLPVLEAMACGTPVIVSSAGALPEVVGDAGRIFDPYEPEELSALLQQLLQEERLRDALRDRGLERARNFSWEQSARTVMAIFGELTGAS